MISVFLLARKPLQSHTRLKHAAIPHDLHMNLTTQIIAPEGVSVVVGRSHALAAQGNQNVAGAQPQTLGRRSLPDRSHIQTAHSSKICAFSGHYAPATFSKAICLPV